MPLNSLPADWRDTVDRTLGCAPTATIKDLARALGLHKNTMHRYLHDTEFRKHVDDTRAFYLAQLRAGALLKLRKRR